MVVVVVLCNHLHIRLILVVVVLIRLRFVLRSNYGIVDDGNLVRDNDESINVVDRHADKAIRLQ